MRFETTRSSGCALDWLNFFTAAMQSGFGAFVALLLVRDNWVPQDIGLALTISTVASLGSQIPAGTLIDAMRDKRKAAGAGIVGVGVATRLLAQRSGSRPLLLFGWALVPLQAVLYASSPLPYALVVCQILNGFSGAVFGVMMSVVVADLRAATGRFNVTLGALGAAIAAGASLSTLLGGLLLPTLGFTRGGPGACRGGSARVRSPVDRAAGNQIAPSH